MVAAMEHFEACSRAAACEWQLMAASHKLPLLSEETCLHTVLHCEVDVLFDVILYDPNRAHGRMIIRVSWYTTPQM